MRKPSVRFRMMSACNLKSASVQLEWILKLRKMVDSKIFSFNTAYFRPTQLPATVRKELKTKKNDALNRCSQNMKNLRGPAEKGINP